MRLRFTLGVAAVLAIAFGSVLGAIAVRSNETDSYERRQQEQATLAAQQIEAQGALAVRQLASAAAFVQTQTTVTDHEFDVFAGSLLEESALRTTGVIEVVRPSGRAGFERSTGLKILEPSPGGARPAAGRPVYYPIAQARGAGALKAGYDLGAYPSRRRSLRLARDSGRATATGEVRLLSGGTGLNLYLPIYEDGAPTQTVAQRRRSLDGFAAASIATRALLGAASSALPPRVDAALIDDGRRLEGAPVDVDEGATAPLRVADQSWLVVVHDPADPAMTLPLLMAVLGISFAALLGSLVVIWSRNERMQELQRQASQDALTGLKNRRRFEEDLRMELARTRRQGNEGALLMLDLDNFKQVNDTLGHPTGDRVIAEIARVLGARTRETDVLARLGGDEFALVLPDCGPDEALAVATEIATAIREHVPEEQGVPRVTVSIGVAMFGTGSEGDVRAVEVEADAAMYEAKQAGRDNVRLAAPRHEGAEAAPSST